MQLSAVFEDATSAFFESLPAEELTLDEVELVRLLREVASLVKVFLPRGVSLQKWAEVRIPQGAVDDANGSGLVYVKPPPAGQNVQNDVQTDIGRRLLKEERCQSSGAHGGQAGRASAVPESAFNKRRRLETMSAPSTRADVVSKDRAGSVVSLSPKETELRDLLIATLIVNGKTKVVRLVNNPRILHVARACLPSGTDLYEWITSRLSDDILVEQGLRRSSNISCFVYARNSEISADERLAAKAEYIDEWLSTLPDYFTREEENLRTALLRFLNGWRKNHAPMIEEAIEAVQSERETFVPLGVPFKDWVRSRIGEEVEVVENGERLSIGLVGTIDRSPLEK